MNAVPVIGREMRMQARRGFTYNLRVIGAAASIAACAYFGFEHGFAPNVGAELFGFLNLALLITIWILVPFLTADCISRERREGTIGLLFLTPLRAREVVVAKCAANSFRAATLLLAVLPVITICFLLGGVTWKEVVVAVVVQSGSVCWALAAGLLASSVSKTWVRALVLSGFFTGVFAFSFFVLVGISLQAYSGLTSGFGPPTSLVVVRPMPAGSVPAMNGLAIRGAPFRGRFMPQQNVVVRAYDLANCGEWLNDVFDLFTSGTKKTMFESLGTVAALSFLILVAVLLLAAWNLGKFWQEAPHSLRRQQMEAALCTPVVAVGFFRRWMRRKLERNPIGWLEQRTWSGRLVTWGWFAVMVSFYSAVFYNPDFDKALTALQHLMAWSLMGVIAVTAAGSFQRERESRVLELLLVSPMSATDLISGRLRGLWGQFLPALALMIFVWIYLAELFYRLGENGLMTFYCAGFLTLPIIGLYYSLKRATFIGALLSTLFIGLALPYILRLAALALGYYLVAPLCAYFLPYADNNSPTVTVYGELAYFLESATPLIVVQMITALLLYRKLKQSLVNRTFAFQKGAA